MDAYLEGTCPVRHSSFCPSLFLLLFALTAAAQNTAGKAAPKPEADAPAATQLPVTRVSLYKNGVGFFEHSGRVTGSQSVAIDFTTAQLNDVLQSLTAIDLDGGCGIQLDDTAGAANEGAAAGAGRRPDGN
jgi:hypothetical protein